MLPHDLKNYRAPWSLRDFTTQHGLEIIIVLLILAIVLERYGIWA